MARHQHLLSSLVFVLLICLISLAPTRRNVRTDKLLRQALLFPGECAGLKLLQSSSDSSFTACFGLNVSMFNKLLMRFEKQMKMWKYDRESGLPVRRIQQRQAIGLKHDVRTALAMCCIWLRSRCEQRFLSLVFGIVPSVVCELLHVGLHCLLEALRLTPKAVVKFPYSRKRQLFTEIISMRYPRLKGAIGFLDGLKLPVHPPTEEYWRNAMYNGWTCDYYVSNLILFGPDGCIFHYVSNTPGSWNDARLARDGGVYAILDNRLDEKQFVVADSIFPAHGTRIKRPPKMDEKPPTSAEGLLFNRDLISARQSAEWGMGGLERTFPRLTARFIWETKGLRGKILLICYHLFNFRARELGLNQIRTVWCHSVQEFLEALR
jgi:hypothetical protein